jgi:RNA polymerase sigma factor (sigma-70 family)
MPDTTGRGGGYEFPVTTWALIKQVQDTDPTTRRGALESLCRRYWKPAFHYIRAAWAKSHEDAKDLTQAFFLHLLEGDALAHYTPSRGGFRPYLKAILRHFTSDRCDAMRALKRGGGTKVIPFELLSAQLADQLVDPDAVDPEGLFDATWKKEILERALDRTRQWFAAPSLLRKFQVFEAYDLATADGPPTYAQLAERMGIKDSDVRNYLCEVRERLRHEARAEIAQTVTDLDELDAEWKELFGS